VGLVVEMAGVLDLVASGVKKEVAAATRGGLRIQDGRWGLWMMEMCLKW